MSEEPTEHPVNLQRIGLTFSVTRAEIMDEYNKMPEVIMGNKLLAVLAYNAGVSAKLNKVVV